MPLQFHVLSFSQLSTHIVHPKSSYIPGSFWYQELYVLFPHLFTLFFSSLSMMGPLLTFSFMLHVTSESWQLSRHGLDLEISIFNLSHIWIFFWSDFLPGLEEAMKRRERVQPTFFHILLKKRKKSKELLAGSSTPTIDWVIGSPQCGFSLRLRDMNHFLMTPLRSQQLSMQPASTVELQVRRAGGVCSWAACHMLFLTISRC